MPRRRDDYSWLKAPATQVPQIARQLLGWELTAHGVTVRLTELEAYAGQGQDPASHAHRGPTPRSQIMFGPPGHAYVYFIFGMYWCLNIVCGAEGEAAAVLVRAGEVVAGHDLARTRRTKATRAAGSPGQSARPAHVTDAGRGVPADWELARGPARLVTALGIRPEENGTSMVGGGPIQLTAPIRPAGEIVCGPRVGVAQAHDVPWRFWIAGDRTVSPYRRHVPKSR